MYCNKYYVYGNRTHSICVHDSNVKYYLNCDYHLLNMRAHTYYSLFTFSWPRFESGSLHNGGMLILRS